MFIIESKLEDILDEFPIVQDWINIIKNDIVKNPTFNDKKIDAYYTYGFFVPTTQSKYEEYVDQTSLSIDMLFSERIDFEMSKVRSNINIKIGNCMFTNRLPYIPKVISDIVCEITKVKMTIETRITKNLKVQESIPPISDKISFEVIGDNIESGLYEEELDIDQILDKISRSGLQSLTKREMDFLNKKSKE